MADENNEIREEFAPFDPNKKKKKKKIVLQDLGESSTGPRMEKSDSMTVNDDDGDLENTFTGMKKKKKQVESSSLNDENVAPVEEHLNCDDEGSDRDYLYEELLGRVYNILREHNPDLANVDRRRTVMRPPQILREGTKKTVFVNFMDLCKTMHRQPDHVMQFLLDEMGTTGSLDGQQRLVVKGRFAPKNFEAILRKYVTEYVICLGCKSPDTILTKENRLIFVRCEKCGSGRSVTQIKQGFVARVSRRKN